MTVAEFPFFFVEKFKHLISNILKNYHYYVQVIGDPRVENWFLISSPLPTFMYIIIYLTLIYKILPSYMKDRKPFALSTIIRGYNLLQIVACSTLVYNLVTPLSEPAYVWKCENFKFSNSDPLSLKRVSLSYYFFLIKAAELVETVFFMLRKKFNQVTALHVHHHVSTLMLAWIYGKYFAGGLASTCMTLNCSVHVVMNTYYLFASLGPYWQKKVSRWKPAITTLQMVQLFLLISHSTQIVLNKECGLQGFAFYVYAPNVATMFFMFRNFYKRNYSNRKKE